MLSTGFRSLLVAGARMLRVSAVRTVPVALTRRHQWRPVLSQRFQLGTTALIQGEKPQLMIAFTCKKCNNRSSHLFSKQAYLTGSVMIECPGCHAHHLIADHLGIFKDNKFDLQKYLQDKGENVGGLGDLVFEDIPEDMRGTLGRYAKDAPEEYQDAEESNHELPPAKDK